MKRQQAFTILSVAFTLLCFSARAQIDSVSVKIPQLTALQNNQNLVSKAIDGAVYLIRQEYLLESPSGERLGRGILNYFGKTYRIGVLVNRDLWMPSSIMQPWVHDPNFKEFEKEYKPVCSYTRIKKINSEEEYRVFELKEYNVQNLLTSFKPGFPGLNATDSLPDKVKLQLYYVEADGNPDDANSIKSTIVNLNAVQWNEEGKAEVNDLLFKDRVILGGAVFIERVSLGRIDIELVALYTEEEENWVLQTVSPAILQKAQSN